MRISKIDTGLFAYISIANRDESGKELMALRSGHEGDPRDKIFQAAKEFLGTTSVGECDRDEALDAENETRERLLQLAEENGTLKPEYLKEFESNK